MSGIQIHTDDPISPTKASGTSPRTANADAVNLSQPGNESTQSPYVFPPAQPAATAPTLTSKAPQESIPPAPQPGAIPVAPPPTKAVRLSVPPPPKVGEKPLSPEQYAPVHSTPTQPLQYPTQMSQPMVHQPLRGLPPGSATSTSTEPSFNPSASPTSLPPSTDMPPRASLEHPPGYVQNPFASDMTPDQRYAAEEEQRPQGNRSETLPSLGYMDPPKGPRPGLEDDQTIWGQAKKWVKETGEHAGRQAEELWNQFGADK